jgi:hypothetical protein
MYSSRTDSATLLSNGDRIDPYEQGWVMRSAGLLALVTATLVLEHCA